MIVNFSFSTLVQFSRQSLRQINRFTRSSGYQHSKTRNISSSSAVMSSSKFQLADKYKGLEKNVWYIKFTNFYNAVLVMLYFVGFSLLI
jgi:hypothetical protein